jgi:hypothetical protein
LASAERAYRDLEYLDAIGAVGPQAPGDDVTDLR